MYDEINSFVSYVKDAAEGGSSKEMAYVLVGEPKREYLWILSRAPQMEESTYRMLVGKAAQKGFDPAKIRKMKQDCAK